MSPAESTYDKEDIDSLVEIMSRRKQFLESEILAENKQAYLRITDHISTKKIKGSGMKRKPDLPKFPARFLKKSKSQGDKKQQKCKDLQEELLNKHKMKVKMPLPIFKDKNKQTQSADSLRYHSNKVSIDKAPKAP